MESFRILPAAFEPHALGSGQSKKAGVYSRIDETLYKVDPI